MYSILLYYLFTLFGQQGWRSGDCTRLPPTWAGFGPRVGYVGCWFFTLLQEVFLRVLQFSPLLKNQQFQIPSRSDPGLP